MRITVFGATGRTGIPFVQQALDRGHEVVAFVRSPEKLTISHEALTVVHGDAYTGEGVAEAVDGADAIVSVLGQTSDGPDDLVTVAGEHITTAMAEAGVSRFVTLVGAGVRTEGERISVAGKLMGGLLKLVARSALEDAVEHAARLESTDLEWTLVRAPRLTDGDGDGEYRAGDIALGFDAIARADVARFILDCLEADQWVQERPKVTSA